MAVAISSPARGTSRSEPQAWVQDLVASMALLNGHAKMSAAKACELELKLKQAVRVHH